MHAFFLLLTVVADYLMLKSKYVRLLVTYSVLFLFGHRTTLTLAVV